MEALTLEEKKDETEVLTKDMFELETTVGKWNRKMYKV